MRLPEPWRVADLCEQYRITARADRELLDLASSTFWLDPDGEIGDCLPPAAADAAATRVSGPLLATWQTAEALWLSAGLLPPVLEWPWPTLNGVIGCLLAGDVWVIGARTGEGKSTFIANLIRLSGWSGAPRMMIAPLEVSPAAFQMRLAALDIGYPVKAVVRQEWWLAGVEPEAGRAAVQAAVRRQGEAPLRDCVRYCPAETLDRSGLVALVAAAAAEGHRLIIVDHLHHMDHGDGPEHRGIRETMKAAKALAREYDVAILFTAQLGRGDVRDRRRKFFPPELTDLQGASAIEQVADGVLLLYQPLLPGTRAKDIDAVLCGERAYRDVFKSNAVAVKCAKHRLDGSVRNHVLELVFDDGEIRDPRPANGPVDANKRELAHD
jgi:replicative DNA helicase